MALSICPLCHSVTPHASCSVLVVPVLLQEAIRQDEGGRERVGGGGDEGLTPEKQILGTERGVERGKQAR